MSIAHDFTRRRVLAAAATVAGAIAAPAIVRAQAAWPGKPVRVIVTYPAGGGADTLARIYFNKLSEDLGQAFVIENRGGAGGTIGAGAVAKAAPDGYTILHDATAFSVNPTLVPALPYDTAKDFAPVFLAGIVPNLFVAHPDYAARTVADVITAAKAESGTIPCASAGNGSVQHLALELFQASAGVKLNHVPFKGGGPALNDLMGGHVKLMFSNAAASTNHVRSGKLRALAHSGEGRLKGFPDLPAVAETLPGYAAYEWNGMFVPTGTPPAIVERLNAALNSARTAPALVERFAQLSVETRANTPAEFGAFVAAETAKWGRVVRDGGIKNE